MLAKQVYISGFLVAAVLMLCSCAKQESSFVSDAQQAISFAPIVQVNSSKATDDYIDGVLTGTSLPTNSSFTSVIFYLPHDENGSPLFNKGGHFMSLFEPVKYTDNKWQTDAVHYWPLSGCCYFIAFYPQFEKLDSLKMRTGYSGDRNQNFYITGYTIKHFDDSTKSIVTEDSLKTDANLTHAHVDLMSAKNLFEDVQARTAGEGVPMVFAHGLTRLKFSIQTASDYSAFTKFKTVNGVDWYWLHSEQFWIDEIKLTDIYSKGDYSLSAPHWSSTSMSEPYDYYPLRQKTSKGTEAVYKVTTEGSQVYYRNSLADARYFSTGRREPVATFVKEGGTGSEDLSILMIPQRLSSSAELQVKYSTRVMNILTPGNSKDEDNRVMNDHTQTLTRTFKLSEISPLWIAGTSLTYSMVLSLNDINVSVDYSDWNVTDPQEIVN